MLDIENFLSNALIKRLEAEKVVCWNNGKPQTLKLKKGEYSSYQVPEFITKISYPPNKNRDYGVVVYIHFIEYEVKKRIEKDKIKVNSLADYEVIYNQVLDEFNFGSEAYRFYNNWLRRRDFRDARIAGKF